MSTADVLVQGDAEQAVRSRYAAAAERFEQELCCPVVYHADYLRAIPQEILDRDYGCGDPTAWVRPGETVLDLGSGGGKVCFITAQIVGGAGHVIGVDCNEQMLDLARRNQPIVAERLGYANVEFRCGLIQDLQLDLDRLGEALAKRPVQNQADWLELRDLESRLRREQPLIADESIDCVLSNCVLNLVRPEDREQLIREVYRVLKPGGRAAICDIVSDRDVPERLRRDPQLWSGCISGAFREDEFPRAFERAGFHGVTIAKRQSSAWRTVEGIEFRSVTVLAYKAERGPDSEQNRTVIYRGPFKSVEDDDGRFYRRGVRTAVDDAAFRALQREPYTGLFEPVEPRRPAPLQAAGGSDGRCC